MNIGPLISTNNISQDSVLEGESSLLGTTDAGGSPIGEDRKSDFNNTQNTASTEEYEGDYDNESFDGGSPHRLQGSGGLKDEAKPPSGSPEVSPLMEKVCINLHMITIHWYI